METLVEIGLTGVLVGTTVGFILYVIKSILPTKFW